MTAKIIFFKSHVKSYVKANGVMVRTHEDKRRLKTQDTGEIKITTLHLPEWHGNMKELTTFARKIYQSNLQGKEIFNVDTQHKVRFTSEGRGEAFSGIKHSIDAHVVNVLARLVRRAVHVNAIDPDGRRHSDTKKFHCFVAPLRINNEFYAVKLTFREALMSTLGVSHLKFYDVAILKDKIKSPLGHGLSAESTNYPSHVGLSVNIDHLLEVFNGNNEKHRDAWKEKTQEKSFSQSIIFCRRVGHS